MAKHKVEISGLDTSRLHVLKNKDIIHYLEAYREGDMTAQNIIVEGNLRLVLSVVQQFADRYDNMDDLFQIGCIGLIKAIHNFDLSHNVRFSTYAVPMIRGEIKRYLRDNTALKVSRQIKDLAYHTLKAKEEYMNEHQREPSDVEIAELLKVPAYEIKEALNSVQSVASIHDPVFSDNGDTIYIIDQITSDDAVIEKTSHFLTLKEGVQHLDSMQKKIIYDRFYNDKTQAEIAAEFGISQAQVSRLEKNAIQVLKQFF